MLLRINTGTFVNTDDIAVVHPHYRNNGVELRFVLKSMLGNYESKDSSMPYYASKLFSTLEKADTWMIQQSEALQKLRTLELIKEG